MWPRTSWPLSSFTLNIVLGRASETSPSISILSSLLKLPLCARPSPRGLKLGHIDGLGTFVPGLLVVGHFRVLLQRLEAAAVDARVMHEKVSVALVGRYEPVALLVVEPLDRTGGHALALPLSQPHRSRCTIPERGCTLFRIRSGYRGQKYHPPRLEGALASEISATLEVGLTRPFFEERADRVLQVLGGEERRRDLPHPVVGAAYPML